MSNTIVPWEPFRDLVSLREAMDHLFEESFVSPRTWVTNGGMNANLAGPRVDMYETGNEVVVKASLPGIKPEDVDITVTGDVLTISGEMKEETEQKDKSYIRRERRFGSFSRSIELPEGLDVNKADARFDNGLLTLTLPKGEEIKPKKIEVKAKSEVKK